MAANSPLFFDIMDLERDIIKLEITNKELKELTISPEEMQEVRLYIVENEFAIETKLRKRQEIRNSLVEYTFHELHQPKHSLVEQFVVTPSQNGILLSLEENNEITEGIVL
jgi:hypothetical protein